MTREYGQKADKHELLDRGLDGNLQCIKMGVRTDWGGQNPVVAETKQAKQELSFLEKLDADEFFELMLYIVEGKIQVTAASRFRIIHSVDACLKIIGQIPDIIDRGTSEEFTKSHVNKMMFEHLRAYAELFRDGDYLNEAKAGWIKKYFDKKDIKCPV